MKENGGVDESAKNCKGSSQIHIIHIRSRAQCYRDLLSHSPRTPVFPFLVMLLCGAGRTWTQVLFSLGKGDGDCCCFGFCSFLFPRPRYGLDTGEPEKERNLNLSTWLSSRIPTPLSSSSVLQTTDLGRGEVKSVVICPC